MANTTSPRKRTSTKARAGSTTAGSTRRKPSPRKTTTAKTRTEAPSAPPAGKLEAAAREVALAQLGIAAHVLETVAIQMIRARIEAPKQWDGFVKRGEQARRELEVVGDGLRRQITDRVGKFDPRTGIEERAAKMRTVLSMFSRRRATT